MAIAWPDALKITKCDPRLRSLTRSGGRSVSGRQQRVQADAGFWEVTYELPINKPDRARSYEAMIALLRSGQEILARIVRRNQPRGAYGEEVTASLTSEIVPRATQIGITVTGAEIDAGTYIGIGVNRAHVITEVVSGGPADFFNHVSSDNKWDDDIPWSDAGPNAKAYVVNIMPPVRATFGAGTVVKFKDITMRGVLADMSDGDLSLDLGRFGAVTLTIQESI